VNPAAIASIVFACVLGGPLLGMAARPRIPESHLSAESRDVIKLGMGLVATMAARVLGLVIATAKSSYDAQDEAIKHTAAKIVLLDRLLASYGPETQHARELLRRTVEDRLESIWPRDGRERARLGIAGAERTSHDIESRIMRLSPQDEAQRWLQSQALRVGAEIAETRWLIWGNRLTTKRRQAHRSSVPQIRQRPRARHGARRRELVAIRADRPRKSHRPRPPPAATGAARR